MKALVVWIVLAELVAASAFAENWPQWRGPALNGSTVESNLPSEWTTKQGVAWVAALPGYSGATPIVWDDHVFVSSPDEQKNLLLFCIDRKTGAVRWQKTVGTGDQEKGRNNMASPSPVTDGKRVWILFGTGALACYDFEGKEVWSRDLAKEYGRFAINWLYGSSPLLYGNKLYIEVLQSNPIPEGYSQALDDKPTRESFLLCLEPATGKTLWKHIRKTDAFSEAQEAYTTPVPCSTDKGDQIILVGGNYVTAHDPATGEELWRCAGLNDKHEPFWRIVPSPVIAAGLVVACGPKRDPVLAIKPDGRGDVTTTHTAWKFKEFPSDCVTPLFYQNKLFVFDGDRQEFTCLEPIAGAKKWQGKLSVHEIFRASPTGADGKIYCISENGTVVVLSAGDEFKVLSTIPMGEGPVRASIAAAHGQLFIRTAKNLYCVGKSGG
ncbi:MAG TPA: PQQ-binding-like beta-propeller repeat protein [Verrucomicrobiae bacterium]|nr:PQQ-binding-like beta-propeller repeat protein [Verrucomicrobiae bacterium]